MATGVDLAQLEGYPFDVRYSDGALARARVSADLAAEAYAYLRDMFSGFSPDIAVIVAAERDWQSRQPYGLPFFNDDEEQIRPGIVVMPADRGDFWIAIGEDLCDVSPSEDARLLATYPDGTGGLDLQPFFDLITIHELGHAFETLGTLGLPTFWLSEVFANLALHTFVATQRPESLSTLEVLSSVGVRSVNLDKRMRADGYSSLEDFETHYTGGSDPMGVLNYVWYQYRLQRLAADVFNSDEEAGLIRFWDSFRGAEPRHSGAVTTSSLANWLGAHVSETLGQAIGAWR